MVKTLIKSTWPLILIVALIYLLTFAQTPMELDSAEIVTQGKLFGVLHPPGYPLQTLYNHTIIHLTPFLSPIVAVGLANVFVAIATIGLAAALAFRLSGRWGLILVGSLAISPLFWKYATSPEVFIGLQLFAVGFTWLLYDNSIYRKPIVLMFLALSISHHHTIVFLSPWLFMAAWENRQDVKSHMVAICAGLTAFSIYGTLLLAHPQSIYSWGLLDSWQAVLGHFLRQEYGTFSLAVNIGGPSFLERASHAINVIAENAFLPLSVIGWFTFRKGLIIWGKFEKTILFTVVVYIAVFTAAGAVPFSFAGKLVYARFFILPVLLITLLACSFAKPKTRYEKIVAIIFAAIYFCYSGTYIIRESFSGVREEIGKFYKEVLLSLPRNSIVSLKGDTPLFVSYYLQAIENVRPDVVLAPPIVLPWKHKKLQRDFPALFNDIFTSTTNVHEKLLPGVPYHEFGSRFTLSPGVSAEQHEFTYKFYPGELQISFRCSIKGGNYTGPDNPLRYVSTAGYLIINYGLCDFNKGLYLLREKRLLEAKSAFETAVKKNPWQIFAQERLCHTLKNIGEDATDCQKRLDVLIDNTDERYFKDNKFALAPPNVRINWNESNDK